jgi:hypothetical protein
VTPVLQHNEVWHTPARPSRLLLPVISDGVLDDERWEEA